jgi:LysR family nitrogen assimilation transcriptional regulator
VELKQLKYFVLVSEHSSFSRAAAVLGLNQPFLSRQIQRLEQELKRHLFYRHGRGIALTEAGRKFLTTAQDVLRLLDQAAEPDTGLEAETSGRVVVGFPNSLGRVLTVPLVRAFTARFPRADLAIVEGLSRTLHERLIAEKIGIALIYNQAASTLLEIEEIAIHHLCLVMPRSAAEEFDGPIQFEMLASLPLIFPAAPNPIRSMVEAEARRRSIELHISYEIEGIEAILELLEDGFGYTVANSAVLRQGRYSDTLVALPIALEALESRLSLVTLAHRPASVLQSRTAEILRELAKRMLK